MDRSEIREVVEGVLRTLMSDRGTPLTSVDPDCSLYGGGYGLDSMDTATLSAMLGERFDDDPYSSGVFPRNIAEIIEYYGSQATAA
jgi:acyl carrier protein